MNQEQRFISQLKQTGRFNRFPEDQLAEGYHLCSIFMSQYDSERDGDPKEYLYERLRQYHSN